MLEIDDGKSRSCIDERLKDSIEKVQFTKNDKIQEATDELEEMLKMQKETSNQIHYHAFSEKHDIKREVHRQENWKKTHGVHKNKKNPATSLISSHKKDRKMLNSVQVGLKKHSSLSTSKSDNMRSILKIKNPTSHFEDHLRLDVASAETTSHFENHLRFDVSGVVSLILL